ncbi:MAG: zinc-binding alcohol dehydrogenase [Anaerolineales bacterium]|nr:zinc-binding alcohol dehydrogenase [Anaerolineales bacterium]
MPYEIIVASPSRIEFREYVERDPVANEVLVQTYVSGIKSGTELNLYRGANPFVNEVWDKYLRLFRPSREDEELPAFFPHTLGSWASGVVRKVGPGVRKFKPGDLVHGGWKHRQTALMVEDKLYPIRDETVLETMLFTDPSCFALAAIHDASIKVGDMVAIFGMGAIGLIAVQLAKLNGASKVIAIDPILGRLEVAKELGADHLFDPREGDVSIAIKELSGGNGVDVSLEIAGSYDALQQAIRCVHREGLVVTAGYYGDSTFHLDLAREWHHNRVTLRSSMPVWGCSHRHQPMWNLARIEKTVIQLLEEGKIRVDPLIGARLPFERAAEAYTMIDKSPDEKVKIILTYDTENIEV